MAPLSLLKAKGVASHRGGGGDPTELDQSVQPANTARPVGRHTTIILPQIDEVEGCRSCVGWFQFKRSFNGLK